VNSVVLRSDVEGGPSFRELLRRVGRRVLEALEHQELPFERLVEKLAPERDLSRHPLFQVQIALNPPERPIVLPGLESEEVATAKTSSRVDLTLLLQPQADGMDAVWEYSTDLFDIETVDAMGAHFLALLRSIAAEPERPIAELALLGAAERGELLQRLAGTSGGRPAVCLHEQFEARAGETPDSAAVTLGETNLSYGELNRRANRLAHRLRRLGVGPEGLVALCLERSLELVVAILAVLKAGGAYVPLDPEYPPDRLAFVLEDCRAPVLITQADLLERLPAHEAQTVCLERDRELIARESDENLPPLAGPENLAYIIYTSGSTGQPKGVQVEHRHVARLFTATDAWFSPGPGDAWTLLHSHAFDFSVWELWGALLHGGRVVVVPSVTARTPEALAALVAEQRITVLNATPSLFLNGMDELIAVGPELALRLVIFGGEALAPKLLSPWFARFGDERPQLVNMYGITETTVHVTYRPLRATDAELDAMDGSIAQASGIDTYGQAAWSCPLDAGVKLGRAIGGATVTNTTLTPGRRRGLFSQGTRADRTAGGPRPGRPQRKPGRGDWGPEPARASGGPRGHARDRRTRRPGSSPCA